MFVENSAQCKCLGSSLLTIRGSGNIVHSVILAACWFDHITHSLEGFTHKAQRRYGLLALLLLDRLFDSVVCKPETKLFVRTWRQKKQNG